MEAFHSAADYYDALADAPGRIEREQAVLTQCLEKAPGRRVADLACGTGLHALFLAGLGAEVTAFDISPEMIKRAVDARPHSRIEYRTGDMRTLSGGPWDLAVCLGNSLSLTANRLEIEQVFRRVHECLSPGALWVVQVINYSSKTAQQPRHRIEHKRIGDHEIVAVKSLVPHEDRTLLSLAFFSNASGLWESVTEAATLLHITRSQMEEIAQRSGFVVEAVYGSFDRSPYDEQNSPDLIGVFKRP